jgi:hypothetical protein
MMSEKQSSVVSQDRSAVSVYSLVPGTPLPPIAVFENKGLGETIRGFTGLRGKIRETQDLA